LDVKDHDDRVVPAHSFKFAATMQENQKGNNPVLIKIETKSGYGAGMSTKQKKEEVTYIFGVVCFIL
jgi:prolyl oligopeptidase